MARTYTLELTCAIGHMRSSESEASAKDLLASLFRRKKGEDIRGLVIHVFDSHGHRFSIKRNEE